MDEQPAVPVPGSDQASAPALPQADVVQPLEFTGDGWEYFKIWIVNVALTVATLGIYSAWAKVRRLHYFYRNTRLAGSSFDYHGDPIAIFKGRLIAGALWLTYFVTSVTNPFLAISVALGIALIMPFLLSRSFRFRARNSSYRGLRFRFHGTTEQAYWVLLVLPILTFLSLFTLGPFLHHRLKRFQFDNMSFGRMPFVMDAPVSGFYITYLIALAIGCVAFGSILGLFGGTFATLAAVAGPDGVDPEGGLSPGIALLLGIAIVASLAIYIATILTIQALTTARIRNLVWTHTTLGRRRFISTMGVGSLLWLTVTNALGTIFTLGLFWPFAQVRLASYTARTLAVAGPATFEEFTASASPEEDAVGEEVAEFFDFDIAF